MVIKMKNGWKSYILSNLNLSGYGNFLNKNLSFDLFQLQTKLMLSNTTRPSLNVSIHCHRISFQHSQKIIYIPWKSIQREDLAF